MGIRLDLFGILCDYQRQSDFFLFLSEMLLAFFSVNMAEKKKHKCWTAKTKSDRWMFFKEHSFKINTHIQEILYRILSGFLNGKVEAGAAGVGVGGREKE